MANSVSYQVLNDGARHFNAAVSVVMDSGPIAQELLFDVSTLYGGPRAPNGLIVKEIEVLAPEGMSIALWWKADVPPILTYLSGHNELCYESGLRDPKEQGWNGDILISATGWTVGANLRATFVFRATKAYPTL